MRFFIFPVTLLLTVFIPSVHATDPLIEDTSSRSLPIQLPDAFFKQVQKLYKTMKKHEKAWLKEIRRLESSPYFTRLDFKKELKEVMGFRVSLTDASRNRIKMKMWYTEVTEYKRFLVFQASLREGVDLELPSTEQVIYLKGRSIVDNAWKELFTVADRTAEIIAGE